MRSIQNISKTIGVPVIIGAFTLLIMASASRAQLVDIALSHVGNAGNAADPVNGLGAVNGEYDISTYDITEAQYAAFLNAVAKTDPYKLYSPDMATTGNFKRRDVSDMFFHTGSGITRSGEPGRYSYTVVGAGKVPITFVSWFDAARFCNWLQNGQPANLGEVAGSTETGAYTLNGDRSKGTETKNAGVKWWIPTENEWYKAAYYDAGLNGGAGGYWIFPTRSNTPPGNVIGSGSNQANYITNGDFCVKMKLNEIGSFLTPVGSFPKSASYYGTYDQGGDVGQWNDTAVSEKKRGLRGAFWDTFDQAMRSSAPHGDTDPTSKDAYTGFRVAALPQPAIAGK